MVATTAPLGPGLLIFAFPDWIRTWELVIPVAWLILEYAFVLVLWPTLPRMCDPVLRADEDTLLLSHSLRAAPVELKWSDVSAVFPLWNWGELYLGVEPVSDSSRCTASLSSAAMERVSAACGLPHWPVEAGMRTLRGNFN